MDYVVEIAIAVLGANALFSFVQFLITRHDEKKESPERIMLRALGEDRLGVLLRDWLHSDDRYAVSLKVCTLDIGHWMATVRSRNCTKKPKN